MNRMEVLRTQGGLTNQLFLFAQPFGILQYRRSNGSGNTELVHSPQRKQHQLEMRYRTLVVFSSSIS